jgi:hypothetical protein
LSAYYDNTAGLVSDKIKAVLSLVWRYLSSTDRRGIIFAYDEAQNLADHSEKDEYPLSTLLDVFQSIQKQGIPFMLVLAGLPTLYPKLVEARTYSERMFHVIMLDRLDQEACREAVLNPLAREDCPIEFSGESVETICNVSGGYPYFIQFLCKECYDIWVENSDPKQVPSVPVENLIRKLDVDFFAGRWARATDRQRELLCVIASLETSDDEFTVQETVGRSKLILDKPFTSSHVNQMLVALANQGLVYKDRHGKYLLSVPLLRQFIRRQAEYLGLDSSGSSSTFTIS